MSLKLLITDQMLYMQRKGFDVEMVSSDGDVRDELIQSQKSPHHVVEMTRKISPIKDLKALFQMISVVRKVRPNIIHTHTPKAGLIGMMAAFFCRVPIRIHTLAGWRLETETGLKRKLLYSVEWLTFKMAHEVWPNSYSLLNMLKENSFARKTKYEVIGNGGSNGIDVDFFSSKSADKSIIQEIKSTIDYDPTKTYLVFVGRINKDKGVEELIRVFHRLQNPDLVLILVGRFEYSLDPISKESMEIIEANDNVRAVGFSPNVREYLSFADLLVHPSHREGFPNVPLQAGSMGVPIICSEIGGNVDIVTHEQTGLLFNVKDEDDLFEKINYALNNRDTMTVMANKQLENITNNFSRDFVQAELYKHYERLLKQKKI